jgi:succinyl-diaminopimelate desuccinylase
MNPTVELAKELISRASLTPLDEGCQDLIARRLKKIGFNIENMPFEEVKNLWATYGEDGPLFIFLGHTDVVPTGPIDNWKNDPFSPLEENGFLFGRGAADMKGSVAAFVTAIESFVNEHKEFNGRIGLMLTSDEEGPSVNGVRKVIQELQNRQENIDWCLVGEPTANHQVGDVIKIGRRGSLGASVKIEGIQGHVAYPQKALNPIHESAGAINEITKLTWKDETGEFQDSVLQISNLNSGTGASNVIPGDLIFDLNVRFSPSTSEEEIKESVEKILSDRSLNYSVTWNLSGNPFLTKDKGLIDAVKQSISEATGIVTQTSTDGGTSDGRFIAPTGAEVVELGPVNESIHKINECIKSEDLITLSKIYNQILVKLLTNS